MQPEPVNPALMTAIMQTRRISLCCPREGFLRVVWLDIAFSECVLHLLHPGLLLHPGFVHSKIDTFSQRLPFVRVMKVSVLDI